VPPPPEELAALVYLARRGNMRKIWEQAALIEQMDKKYQPFAHTLEQLAKSYQEEEVRAFLEHYKGESQ
jgi:hypothetical protein